MDEYPLKLTPTLPAMWIALLDTISEGDPKCVVAVIALWLFRESRKRFSVTRRSLNEYRVLDRD